MPNYLMVVNCSVIPAMISLRGDNAFLSDLFVDFMDIPHVLNCIDFQVGPVDHFNIYINPVAHIAPILRLVEQIIDDAYLVEEMVKNIDLDGKTKSKKTNRPPNDG